MKGFLITVLIGLLASLTYAADIVSQGYIDQLTQSSNHSIKRSAQSIYKTGENNTEVLDVAAEVLLQRYPTSSNADIDTLAWLAKALGNSRNARYYSTLKEVANSNAHGKLRKYAMKAQQQVGYNSGEQYVKGTINLAALQNFDTSKPNHAGGQFPQSSQVPNATGNKRVKDAQQALLSKGYNPGPADGVMGKMTVSAVKSYQSDNSLTVTGSIDNATYYSLTGVASSQATQQRAAYSPDTSASTKTRTSTVTNTSAEEEARKKHSFNDSRVNYQASCPELFIPYIGEKRFQDIIPVYAMQVLNNSDKRYSVKYDLVYGQKTENVLGRHKETLIETKEFRIRPGAGIEILLAEVSQGGGARITSIDAIDIFECTSP